MNNPFSSTQQTGCLMLDGDVTSINPLGGHKPGRLYVTYPLNPGIPIDGNLRAAPGNWFPETISRSNPSRPNMTPPTILQDILQIPRQVRDVGSLLRKPSKILSAKELANQHLAVRFGWMPLVEDLHQLLGLQTLILRRTKELGRLYSGKGLRRRLTFLDDTTNGVGQYPFALFGGVTYTASYDVQVVKKQWATIRWKPETPPPYSIGDEKMNRLVIRLVLGLTPEGLAKGAWDVLPWTWLINWFNGIGYYFKMYSTTVPATHGEACFMNECTVTLTPKPITFVNCKGSLRFSGVYKRTIKSRAVAFSTTPGFTLPFIGGSELSILGSLFVQRFSR